MSITQLRRDIQELKKLKNSIITQHEPQFKIFDFRVEGLTADGETEDDVNTYIAAHPHTHVLKFFRKSFRKV
ncbi:MAG TPA: hypothetical protein VGK06_04150 [Methanosarcina sp.]